MAVVTDFHNEAIFLGRSQINTTVPLEFSFTIRKL